MLHVAGQLLLSGNDLLGRLRVFAIRVHSESENHKSAFGFAGGHHRPTSPMPLPAMPGLRKRLLVSNMSDALCHRAPARKDAGILQLDRGVFLHAVRDGPRALPAKL
jgi:hypothetical protein